MNESSKEGKMNKELKKKKTEGGGGGKRVHLCKTIQLWRTNGESAWWGGGDLFNNNQLIKGG